jgi:2-polyprenyl-3-methyl-5-hydroxy-6-metoxy-1,4-benzoquinol methylase
LNSVPDQYESTAVSPAVGPETRFAFGKNWAKFLAVLDDRRIHVAEEKLSEWLGDLRGRTFLDIGSGSGLHSLAAVRLGASRVVSFDYDEDCVGCTQELRRRFAPDANWTIEQGSALDKEYLQSLGVFDVVYSWGVLHHTGGMWSALENATIPLGPSGALMLAIYNDAGIPWTRVWTGIKRTYNRIPHVLWAPYVATVMAGPEVLRMAYFGPAEYVRRWREYGKNRGMSRWHDMVDWVGGYPYEVATPEQIFDFYHSRSFNLERMRTCAGKIGCNEFLFTNV